MAKVDWKAIDRDQKAIDKLPNKGRVSVDHSKASKGKMKNMAEKHKPWHAEAKKGFPNSKKPVSVFGEGAFNKGWRTDKK
jgi:uncharacterized protein YktB (UPF0637 family)